MQYTEAMRFKALEFAMGLTGSNSIDSALEFAKAIESFTQFGDEEHALKTAALNAARTVAIRQGAEDSPKTLIANATIFFEYLRPSTFSQAGPESLQPDSEVE